MLDIVLHVGHAKTNAARPRFLKCSESTEEVEKSIGCGRPREKQCSGGAGAASERCRPGPQTPPQMGGSSPSHLSNKRENKNT